MNASNLCEIFSYANVLLTDGSGGMEWHTRTECYLNNAKILHPLYYKYNTNTIKTVTLWRFCRLLMPHIENMVWFIVCVV